MSSQNSSSLEALLEDTFLSLVRNKIFPSVETESDFSNLSVKELELVDIVYDWALSRTKDKASLFELFPKYRPVYSRICREPYKLYRNLKPPLLGEYLHLIGHGNRIEVLDAALGDLNVREVYKQMRPEEAINCILDMSDNLRRNLLMALGSYQQNVLNGITENQLKRKGDWKQDKGEWFVATKDFLKTLPPDAQRCYATDCPVQGQAAQAYQGVPTIYILPCGYHSYHCACAPIHESGHACEELKFFLEE